MAKRRRATPRLLRVLGWGVERAERFRRHGRPELDGDVVLLLLHGEWEHGQRQTVRGVLPVGEVEPLAVELLAAVGVDRGAGVSDPPSTAPVTGSAAPSPPEGAAAGEVGMPLRREPSRPPLASAPPADTKREALLVWIGEHLDDRFGDRPARRRFVDPVLRRNDVSTLEALPTPELARMATQLATPST